MTSGRIGEGQRLSLWQRVKRIALTDVGALVRGMNAADLEALERTLIEADFGVQATVELVQAVEDEVRRSPKLRFNHPWFDEATLGAEREGSARRAAVRENLAEIFVEEYFSRVPADWAALFPAHLARATLVEAATTGRGNRGRKGSAQPEDRLVSALRRAEELLAS